VSGPDREPPDRCGLAVVGGGIVGLAVARELTARFPGLSLCVLEREGELAGHQSSHNSGVIHAGVYYEPGSLKARLCVEGARRVYEYCEAHRIEHRRCGKLILARERAELPRLHELDRRARANGVPGVRLVGPAEVAEIEPHATALEGLHSPYTGSVDFRALALSFADDARAGGAALATGCEVRSISHAPRAVLLAHTRGTLHAEHAIFCAGAWSDRLARGAGGPADPRIVPFRGAYLRVDPEHRHLVRSLIYPVPDPAMPFLGVHLTRLADGELVIGPAAMIVGARDGYRPTAMRGADLLDTLTWPGTWRLGARLWRNGLGELRHSLVRSTLLSDAATFVPELRGASVSYAFAGVRAQALGRDGRLIEDFAVSLTGRSLHVRNAPSPAATASLAIAEMIVEKAAHTFALRRTAA
jgi:(S)-2-hydroxyglutarate dehydrogenase